MRKVLSFTDPLRSGKRPDIDAAYDARFMSHYEGMRVTAQGARARRGIVDPFPSLPVALSHPGPQLLRLRAMTLLAYPDALYVVDESDWSTSLVATVDKTTGDPLDIPAGGAWHVLDAYSTLALFNGACMVWKVGEDWYVNDFTTALNGPTILTGCNWRDGRGVLAGFNWADTFSAVDWPSHWTGFEDEYPAFLQGLDGGLGPNWLFASSIGGGDLWWLVWPEMMLYGPELVSNDRYNEENPFWLELWFRNEATTFPLPWAGKVLAARELGDVAMIYGGENTATGESGGISSLRYSGEVVGLFPIPGLEGFGVASRTAVGGDSTTHAIIDESGELHIADATGGGITVLRKGHKETFSSMDLSALMISFDAQYREFHFCDGDQCHVLNESGLWRSPDRPTSVAFAQGALLGVFDVDAAVTPYYETNIITLREMPYGELSWVRIHGQGNTTNPTEVSVKYRTHSGRDWAQTAWKAVDGRGMARIQAPGAQWKICVRGDDDSRSWYDMDAAFTDEQLNMHEWSQTALPGAAQE